MLLAALCSTSCRTKQVRIRTEETSTHIEQQKVDSIHEQVLVVVYDTVRVVTTITVQVNEAGDTLRTDRITDRSSGQLRVESGLLTVFSNERHDDLVEVRRVGQPKDQPRCTVFRLDKRSLRRGDARRRRRSFVDI